MRQERNKDFSNIIQELLKFSQQIYENHCSTTHVFNYPLNKSKYTIATFTIKCKSHFHLVLLVLLIIGSIIFLKYKKPHLTNNKDDSVKMTLIFFLNP